MWMPRPPRIDWPNTVYHVFGRGVKQLPLFRDALDFRYFLKRLQIVQDQKPFYLHAYCLMTNHYHLLLETIDESISGIMHGILQRFSKWSNWRYEQSGHVFQGRFRNLPVQTDRYFTTVARYIHLNPVHAGMVGLPEEYEWSSYRDLIRGVSPKCIRTDTLLSYFGQNPMIQSDRYQQFVNDGIRQKPEVTDAMLRRKRYWGSPDFFNLPQQKI